MGASRASSPPDGEGEGMTRVPKRQPQHDQLLDPTHGKTDNELSSATRSPRSASSASGTAPRVRRYVSPRSSP